MGYFCGATIPWNVVPHLCTVAPLQSRGQWEGRVRKGDWLQQVLVRNGASSQGCKIKLVALNMKHETLNIKHYKSNVEHSTFMILNSFVAMRCGTNVRRQKAPRILETKRLRSKGVGPKSADPRSAETNRCGNKKCGIKEVRIQEVRKQRSADPRSAYSEKGHELRTYVLTDFHH